MWLLFERSQVRSQLVADSPTPSPTVKDSTPMTWHQGGVYSIHHRLLVRGNSCPIRFRRKTKYLYLFLRRKSKPARPPHQHGVERWKPLQWRHCEEELPSSPQVAALREKNSFTAPSRIWTRAAQCINLTEHLSQLVGPASQPEP